MDSYMKKKLNHFLAVVLAFALLCSTTALDAFAAMDAEENFAITGTVGGAGEGILRVSYVSGGDAVTGSLEVPGGDAVISGENVMPGGDADITATPQETGTDLERNYIQKLTIAGVEQEIGNKYQVYTETLKGITESQEIAVTFGKEYGIRCQAFLNGALENAVTVTLNGGSPDETGIYWVDSETSDKNLALNIQAVPGYAIERVTIKQAGKEDVTEETDRLESGMVYSKEMTADAATEITVEVAEVFTVNLNAKYYDEDVNVNSEFGTMELVSQNDGTVCSGGDAYTYQKADGSVSFKATAKENYRVAGVRINGVEADTENWETNQKTYEAVLNADGGIPSDDKAEYNITVTFAKTKQNITLTYEHAQVYAGGKMINSGEAAAGEWGTKAELVIKPDKGWHLADVLTDMTGSAAEGGLTSVTDFAVRVSDEADGVHFTTDDILMRDSRITFVLEKNAEAADDLAVDDSVVGKTEIAGTYYTLKFTNPIVHWGVEGAVPVIILPKDTQMTVTPNTADGTAYTHMTVNDNGTDQYATGFAASVPLNQSITLTEIHLSTDGYGWGTKNHNQVLHVNCGLKVIVDDKNGAETLFTPEMNAEACYNHDVKVDITVKDQPQDAENASGIATVVYSVGYLDTDGKTMIVTQGAGSEDADQGVLYEYEDGSELTKKLVKTITIDSHKNNVSNVAVQVEVTDNTGNVSTATAYYDIDITAPTVDITFNNNDYVRKDAKGNAYFNGPRIATVVVHERSNHFDPKRMLFNIKATDAAGHAVEDAYDIQGWSTQEGAAPDEAVHTATVAFKKDAHYIWSVGCTDRAGNAAQEPDTHDSAAPFEFTVDHEQPKGKVSVAIAGETVNVWEKLLQDLSFGTWSSKLMIVTAIPEDAVSPIYSVEYYRVSGTAAEKILTAADLDALEKSAWKPFKEILADKNEQFVVYAKITDYADNYTYISSQGLIVDSAQPGAEVNSPVVSVSGGADGISKGDVPVNISVVDPMVNAAYSGLKEVSYQVTNGGAMTQQGVLYSFDKANPQKKDLQQAWSGSILVDSSKNNSNEVKVTVTAIDNAGNITTASLDNIMIDITAPVVNINYNNNAPENEKYYKTERIATVAIQERNFNPSNVSITIESVGGSTAQISDWASSGSGDDTVHTATITYAEDDEYTFGIKVTDKAGNEAQQISYAAGTANDTNFIIDKTLPVIDVRYDNNDAANDTYFNAERTATITVTEHNFDPSLVEFTRTASVDGRNIEIPSVNWSSQGDVHTAAIHYSQDGDYTFDVTMADLAGNVNEEVNYGGAVAAMEFTVDTTVEKPMISGVEDGHSYKGAVIPKISFGDVNYAAYEIQLLRTRKDEINRDVTELYMTGINENGRGGEGTFDTFAMTEENDGIYTLTVTMTDKAGNEETETIMFTVNRFGSVYVFHEYLISLEDAYVQRVDEDIVITEYNPDRLVANSVKILISRDGTPLENVSYRVNPVVGNEVPVGESGWYQYEYTIAASNFAEDGIYRLSVSSEDSAGNRPETTNFENYDVLFRVDTVPAEITSVRGLEESIVNAESHTVEFDVFDAIGLKKVSVLVDDKPAAEYEEFEDLIHFSGSLTLTEGVGQAVRLIVEDLAGNITDTQSESFQPAYTFRKQITVSTNAFIRFYANKPLFFGVLGGSAAVVAGGAAAAVILSRRKRMKVK